MGKRILIVGGVAGGAGTAARLRRLDESAEISIFERGEYVSFANCGLPYYTGGVIRSRDALLLTKPEALRRKFNLGVFTRHEVTAIDRATKEIAVKNLETGVERREKYDVLVLAAGSSPVRPRIPGIDDPRVMTLWTIPDADRVRAAATASGARRAVVVGGGFIGLEMAENLRELKLDVSLVEMLPQVLPTIDPDMAQLLHEAIERAGVHLHRNDGVDSFVPSDDALNVKLKGGTVLPADLVVLSIGVRPNGELARAAGLTMNAQGGVVVDDHLRTSDPDIYAVGDVIEVEDFVFKGRAMVPLAGPANKQARICANNIMGLNDHYQGTQGTSVVKVFDRTAAMTGQGERALIKRGMIEGRDYKTALVLQQSHAGYYPGASVLALKILFSPDGRQIFGAQAVGAEGVEKRIDVIATAMRLGGGVDVLTDLELSYAPPYSSAKDPVNMAGFVAENVLNGSVRFCRWDALDTPDEGRVLLDVREDAERLAYALPGALSIPLGELRGRLHELPREKEIVVFCAIGARSYNGARILMQNSFTNVTVYPGGTQFYRMTHYTAEMNTDSPAVAPAPVSSTRPSDAAIELDCCGLQCPGPIAKVYETLGAMAEGQVLEVSATDAGFLRDVGAWCRRTGNTLLSAEQRGSIYAACIQKGLSVAPVASVTPSPATSNAAQPGGQGKTIVVFSGDMDKVLASFIIATGAAAMGRKVTMFFTFWGLNALRKPEKVRVHKSLIERMFGAMMPRGARRLKLSKMNMAGMGTAMMKMVMKQKNVDPLEEMIARARRLGVKLVACTMSMDVMGIHKEELLDGVELGGVAAMLGDAEESDMSLFV